MNVLDELKRKDEEAHALLSAEVGAVTVRIDELTTYRNSLYTEMKRRGYALDSTLISTTNEPSSIAVVPVKSGIVHVSKDEPTLPERILDLLSDGVPRSLDEVFIAISGKPGLKRSTVSNRLHEMKMHGRVATMPNDREGAQPGSYLYLVIENSSTKNEAPETIVDTIRIVAADGKRRTKQQLHDLVSYKHPNVSPERFQSHLVKSGLWSTFGRLPNSKKQELLYWQPKDGTKEQPSPIGADRTKPTLESVPDNVVQMPAVKADYPLGKLIMRFMSDGRKRTKAEIFDYVRRFNEKTNLASVGVRITQVGLTSETETRPTGTVRVYYFPIASSAAISVDRMGS